MIPTMLLFGLILGRWWKTCLVAGTLFWTLLLWTMDIIESPNEFLSAGGLAALNTLVGVGIHQLVLRLARSQRGSHSTADKSHA